MSAKRPADVTVVGAGYVGLVTAVGLASRGVRVKLVEIADERRLLLQSGQLPISEPGLWDLFQEAVRSDRLSITHVMPSGSRLVLICVGTPIGDSGSADLTQLASAIEGASPSLSAGAALVIRSTMPVGSSELVRGWVGGHALRTFSNPEFLRQGNAISDFMRPFRAVIGRYPGADLAALEEVVATVSTGEAPLLLVGMEDANLIKNGANAFLALKLSFANELSVLCEETGADIEVVLDGIGRDPRIGKTYLKPSFGFGGSCLPKELRTLADAGNAVGLPMLVTDAASAANLSHQKRFAQRVLKSLAGIPEPKVAVLGLAFKADTDDVRSSPALHLAGGLIEAGVHVVAYDPAASANALRELEELVVESTAEATMVGAHAAVIATEWSEFCDIDWRWIRDVMARPVIFDGRRLLDAEAMMLMGFEYETIGRGRPAIGAIGAG